MQTAQARSFGALSRQDGVASIRLREGGGAEGSSQVALGGPPARNSGPCAAGVYMDLLLFFSSPQSLLLLYRLLHNSAFERAPSLS